VVFPSWPSGEQREPLGECGLEQQCVWERFIGSRVAEIYSYIAVGRAHRYISLSSSKNGIRYKRKLCYKENRHHGIAG